MASTPALTGRHLRNMAGFTGLSCIVIGYGLAWLSAARRSPIRATEVRLLAGLMLVSAVGRVISLVHNGRPHWFQEVLTAVEFIVPTAFFGLAEADEAQTVQKAS
jgi:hypothetical protein